MVTPRQRLPGHAWTTGRMLIMGVSRLLQPNQAAGRRGVENLESIEVWS
jgi:hypothetical protein